MVRFIHLSDLHIKKDMKKTENKNCIKVVEFIINKYLNEATKPIILITGDIVDDGEEKQYKAAVKILKPLTEHFTILACPGNHDYGPCGNFYAEESQALFQKYILGNLLKEKEAQKANVTMEKLFPTEHTVDNVVFLGVDSVVGNENEFGHFASGEVGEKQRIALTKKLKAIGQSGKKAVVYFHHHPIHYQNGIDKPFMEMEDAKQVLRILATQTHFVCFGHRHKTDVYSSDDIDADIDYILASGKTTERNKHGKFKFREGYLDVNEMGFSEILFNG
jgi:predicted MPP superfamily phosphohydrolase